jgi:hypothetical protein
MPEGACTEATVFMEMIGKILNSSESLMISRHVFLVLFLLNYPEVSRTVLKMSLNNAEALRTLQFCDERKA